MSQASSDRVGVVEQRGIELMPENERHGKPRDLFFMWLGTNTNVFLHYQRRALDFAGPQFSAKPAETAFLAQPRLPGHKGHARNARYARRSKGSACCSRWLRPAPSQAIGRIPCCGSCALAASRARSPGAPGSSTKTPCWRTGSASIRRRVSRRLHQRASDYFLPYSFVNYRVACRGAGRHRVIILISLQCVGRIFPLPCQRDYGSWGKRARIC